MTNTGSGGSRADGCSHLGCHCEEGLPFWWRLTGYLLQDHGNSLICSPRVFPLQQWDQQRRGSGHFDNVEPLSRTTYSKVLTLWWWKHCEAPVWGNTTTTRTTRTTSNWRHFPQDYGNEERVTAHCGRFRYVVGGHWWECRLAANDGTVWGMWIFMSTRSICLI